MTGEALVKVSELGPLIVSCGPKRSTVPGRRSAAVLALLCADRARIRSIHELLEAGWPSPDRPATARQSLANVLSRFRQTYGASFIESSSGGYGLGAHVMSDRADFLDLLSRAGPVLDSSPADALHMTNQALELWRATPWADLDDIDELRIDQSHLVQAKDRLRELRAQALLALGRNHDAAGAFGALAQDNPINEAAWNGWARALGGTQRRVEALRVLDRARASLATSGLLPGVELLATEAQLLQDTKGNSPGTQGDPASTSAALPLALASRPPLIVGRDGDLDALATLWQTTPSGGQLRLVVGAAGVGKTTLVSEFAHRAAERGANVLHGASDDVLNIAFQPYVVALREWIEQSSRALDDPVLASLLGLGPGATTDEPPTLFGALNAFHRAITQVAGSGPTLIVLEDLHWATSETISLTRALARRLPRDVLLVATMRPSKGADDDQLGGLVSDTSRVPSMTHTTLKDLPQQEVSEILRTLAPGHHFESRTIADLAGGNPLLVTELASAIVATPKQDPGWSIAESQLDMFSETHQRMLELAAVLGESFWAEDLAETSGSTIAETLNLLHQASDQRLASLTEAKTWRFRHAVVRAVVLARPTPLALAEHHLRVAEVLAAGQRASAAEIAQHYVAAVGCGGRLKALDWLHQAAAEATEAGSHEQAARHWGHIIEFDRDAEPQSLIGSQMARGKALVRGGFWERSHEPFEAAASIAIGRGDDHAYADAAIAWVEAPENHSAATRFPEFILASSKILENLDASRRARLTAILAIDAMDSNRMDEGLAMHHAAKLEAAELGDSDAQAFVQRARLRTWWDPNQLGARRESALDLTALGRRSGSPSTVSYGLRWQAIHAIESGHLETSRSLCEQLISHGNRHGEPFHVWFGWSRLAVINLSLGSVRASVECLGHARGLADVLDTDYVRRAQSGITLGIQLLLGPDEGQADQPSELLLMGMIETMVRGAPDELGGALALIEPTSMAGFANHSGEFPGRLSWAPMALIAAAVGATDHATALIPLLEGDCSDFAVHIPGASFLGALALHVGVLRSTLGDYDGAIADLEQAIGRNTDVSASVPSAVCWRLLADLFDRRQRAGDAARAKDARDLAGSVAPEFDPAASPLVQALEQRPR